MKIIEKIKVLLSRPTEWDLEDRDKFMDAGEPIVPPMIKVVVKPDE